MAKRSNHYEEAFEAWLRERQVPYVAVDEKRRALAGDVSLKSLDFIVTAVGASAATSCQPACATGSADLFAQKWLVDVKGRRFWSRRGPQWKNWSTADDLASLSAWERLFGAGSSGLLVFGYELNGDLSPIPWEQVFHWKDARYAFVGIRLEMYMAHAHVISARWNTVAMPVAQFRVLARPLAEFVGSGAGLSGIAQLRPIRRAI